MKRIFLLDSRVADYSKSTVLKNRKIKKNPIIVNTSDIRTEINWNCIGHLSRGLGVLPVIVCVELKQNGEKRFISKHVDVLVKSTDS